VALKLTQVIEKLHTRRSLETAVKWFYACDSCLKKFYADNAGLYRIRERICCENRILSTSL
jgi:hypothetical protein